MNELGLLDVDDLARIFKTTQGAIRKRVSRRTLPRPFKQGAKNYWTVKELTKYFDHKSAEAYEELSVKKRGRPRKEDSLKSRKLSEK